MVEQKKTAFQKYTPGVVDYTAAMYLGHDTETGKAYYDADEVDQFIADMQALLVASKVAIDATAKAPDSDTDQLTVAELIGELVRIGNMDAPVWIDGIGALTGVSDDLGQEVILRGSDLEVADDSGA